MRKLIISSLFLFVGALALPSNAAAVPVTCPDSASTTDNEYTLDGTGTTTVLDCVTEFGKGNLNGKLTDPNSDDFLNGPDDDITTDDQYFDGGWTSYCSTDGSTDPGDCGDIYNFSWTGGGGTSGTWSFTGVAGEEYALGVKDGSDPFWAVFLLDSTTNTYSGTWDIVNGGLSHFAIYDRETTDTTTTTTTTTTDTTDTSGSAPEPTMLTLLGGGLLLAGRRLRRRAK